MHGCKVPDEDSDLQFRVAFHQRAKKISQLRATFRGLAPQLDAGVEIPAQDEDRTLSRSERLLQPCEIILSIDQHLGPVRALFSSNSGREVGCAIPAPSLRVRPNRLLNKRVGRLSRCTWNALELSSLPIAMWGFDAGVAAVYAFDLFVHRGMPVGEKGRAIPADKTFLREIGSNRDQEYAECRIDRFG